MQTFINFTNHPSDCWSKNQRSAAESYGDIIDISFPQISPYATGKEIDALVSEYYIKIKKYDCAAIMVQGEFVFTYRLVSLLKENGFLVLSSCSERRVFEYADENGRTQSRSEFEFVGFREY